MDKIVKHGGKRIGAGRKPIADKKIELRVYIEQSKVNVLGKQYALFTCLSAVNSEYEKKIKNI